MKSRIKLVLQVIAGTLALVLLAALGLLAVFCFAKRPGVESRPFDSAAWKRAVPKKLGDQDRLFMIDHLMSDQPLVGCSRAAVVALLGEPDVTPYFKNYDMVYYLGPERGAFGLDSEWLVLKISRGQVTEAVVATD